MSIKKSYIIFLLIIWFILGACVRDEPAFSLQPGDPLPRFSVTTIDGKIFSTENISSDDVRLRRIIFFNTDCGDCRRELPSIQEEYDRMLTGADLPQIEYICISREESEENVRQFWDEHGLTMPVAAQHDRKVFSMFASEGVPRIYTARGPWIITSE